jgi:hypothetical protein
LADNGLEAGIEPASLDATDHATRANGYDASILIDLCKAILAAKAAGKCVAMRCRAIDTGGVRVRSGAH